MNDLEMTKICALAIGLTVRSWCDADTFFDGNEPPESAVPTTSWANGIYDPLHNDKQAMALVKRFGLVCDPVHDGQDFASDPGWEVWHTDPCEISISPDLNRAIVECVANMQAAKEALK